MVDTVLPVVRAGRTALRADARRRTWPSTCTAADRRATACSRPLAPRRVVAFAVCRGRASARARPGTRDEHEVDRWCRLVSAAGGPCDREDLRLELPGSPEDLVLVHPGAAAPSRRWPAGRWAAVVRALADRGHRVVVTGVPAERGLCAGVAGAYARAEDWCGRLDLCGLAERVASARLLLCGDTGVAHLATAVGTPSVLLFGPTDPARWGPALDPRAAPRPLAPPGR